MMDEYLLKEHNITLRNERLTLRPMTENDWDVVHKWENDPEVLYYWEGSSVTDRELEMTQMIYRGVSKHAFVFITELDGRPIGVCWLQEMNLERVLKHFTGLDLRRIDLMIGEKELWGKGWGTQVIGLLTEFGFQSEKCNAIFGCVGDYNLRSRRAFEKNGYAVFDRVQMPEGSESDLMKKAPGSSL